MTITFNRNSETFILQTTEAKAEVGVFELKFLARTHGWGDVQTVIETAQQNPGCTFVVDNTPTTVRYARNRRQYAVLQ